MSFLPAESTFRFKDKSIKLISNLGNYKNETENQTRLFNSHLRMRYNYLKPIDEPVPNEWISIDENFILFILINVPLVGIDFVVEPEMGFDDGYTTIVFVRQGISKYEMIKFIVQCSQGTILKNPYVEYIRVKAFRLEPHNLNCGYLMVDGEPVVYGPIQGEVLPRWAQVFSSSKKISR